MSREPDDHTARLHDAADWVQQLAGTVPPPVDALLHWCQDDRNLGTLEDMAQLWAIAAPPAVAAAPPAGARRWPRIVGCAAAAALVVAALVIGLLPRPAVQVLATSVGERRSWTLADGSEVALAPRSRVEIRFGAHVRAVALTEGQAFFTVHHDTARPFVVRAAPLSVTAVGTAFDVRVGARSVVSVGEGRVQIVAAPPPNPTAPPPAWSLGAGQQYSLERGAAQPKIQAIDAHAAGGWRQGNLQFDGEPLAAVAEALNEYGGRPVNVEGPARTQRFTGTVSVSHVEEWLRAVEVIYAVHVDQTGDSVVIRSVAGDASRH